MVGCACVCPVPPITPAGLREAWVAVRPAHPLAHLAPQPWPQGVPTARRTEAAALVRGWPWKPPRGAGARQAQLAWAQASLPQAGAGQGRGRIGAGSPVGRGAWLLPPAEPDLLALSAHRQAPSCSRPPSSDAAPPDCKRPPGGGGGSRRHPQPLPTLPAEPVAASTSRSSQATDTLPAGPDTA